MSKGHTLPGSHFLTLCAGNEFPYRFTLQTALSCRAMLNHSISSSFLLKNSVSQLVYKHAISTIVPARNVRLPLAEDNNHEL